MYLLIITFYTDVFNIDNNKNNCFLCICDTEDWSNDAAAALI